MRLVSAVLGFLLRKVGLLGATVLSLFLAYLLVQAVVPALREAATDRDRLEQVADERAASRRTSSGCGTPPRTPTLRR